jgi:hypothetical protein
VDNFEEADLMAYEPAQLAAMIESRIGNDDPTLAAVEAVLLRSAFERLDDWLVWLDAHTALEHPHDAAAVGRTLGAVRHKIGVALRVVDYALVRIEE